jgi:acyl-CoA reductase-like NAD-dependent aldehyde dehydrogenase
MPIIEYQDIDQVIQFINNPRDSIREKPLGLYIFTSNIDFQKNVIENTQSGGGN